MHSCAILPTFLKCGRDRETVQRVFAHYAEIRELIASLERIMSTKERVRLLAKSIIKLVLPHSFNNERQV